MNIEDVVKRIDALCECNSLKITGDKDSVEFLFGGQSTGIGVNRVAGGCPACSLEEACCRAYAEILVEELQNHGDEIVLKYEG